MAWQLTGCRNSAKSIPRERAVERECLDKAPLEIRERALPLLSKLLSKFGKLCFRVRCGNPKLESSSGYYWHGPQELLIPVDTALVTKGMDSVTNPTAAPTAS
jgi:hypothetical protein